jgi:superfamily II DNA or RNA helicase
VFPHKKVVFLSGDDAVEIREGAKILFSKNEGNLIFIATYGIFQLGINIPSLQHLFLVSPVKSEIRVLQSIGRALRVHANKVGGAEIYDLSVVNVHPLDEASAERYRYYIQEGFNIRERNFDQASL